MNVPVQRELPVPAVIADDDNAKELVRVWASGGKLTTTLVAEVWDDPFAWGMMLVDLARHVTEAYANSQGREPSAVLARIRAELIAEWCHPTDLPMPPSTWRPTTDGIATIQLVVENEIGVPATGPVGFPAGLIPPIDDLRYSCLRFVDPYGDTVFNTVQSSFLLEDLGLLKSELGPPADHELIGRMEALVEVSRSEPHQYVRFIGD